MGLVRLWLGEDTDGEQCESVRLIADTVNCLFSAGLRLATVRSLLRTMPNHEAPELVDEADERVNDALDEIDTAIRGLRSIVWELDH